MGIDIPTKLVGGIIGRDSDDVDGFACRRPGNRTDRLS